MILPKVDLKLAGFSAALLLSSSAMAWEPELLIPQSPGAPDPAFLAISDAPTFNFGLVDLTLSASHVFTVTNSGGCFAKNIVPQPLNLPFSYVGGSYPGAGGTCGSALAADASCTLVVSFSPSAFEQNPENGTLGLEYFSGLADRAVFRPLVGTSALAILQLDESVDFGNVTVVNPPAKRLVTLRNIGTAAATNIVAPAIKTPPFGYAGPSTYPGAGGTCGTTLAAGASCLIGLAYDANIVGANSVSYTLTYASGPQAGLAVTTLLQGQTF